MDYAEQSVSPKTRERYWEIIGGNIKPILGWHTLDNLKPLHIQSFYTNELERGRKDGRGGLSARTVLHFHRVLHKALAQAVRWQLLAPNPADAVEPPRPERTKMRALDGDQTATLLAKLGGSRLYLPVALAVTTGLRRGELLALRWCNVNLDDSRITVSQSLEQTRSGLRFKSPKTERSRRVVVLPAFATELLRAHKIEQAKARLKLGPIYNDNDLVIPKENGKPWSPDVFSTAFASFIRRSKLLNVRFHDLIPSSIEGDSFRGFPNGKKSESMRRTDTEVRHGQSGCVTGRF